MKSGIQAALEQLKEAHKNQDIQAIDEAMAKLNEEWQKASTAMYQGAQAEGPQDSGHEGDTSDAKGGKNDDGEVTDVDFEEVK